VYHYATSLPLYGHECYVIAPVQDTGYRGGYPFDLVDFLSVKVPTAPQYHTGIALLDLHYAERISKLEFDIVHAHAPGFSGVEAYRLAEKWNVPLVGTFHSKYYDDFLRVTHSDVLASLGTRFVTDLYERCDEVWTVSEDAAETLRSYGFKKEIVIMPNGTEICTPSAASEEKAREAFNLDDLPVLLYVGQIDFKKNLRRTIEAVALLQKHGHRVQLVFAGQGRDREELEKMAWEQGLERVTFTGHITDQELLDGLYMAASLFVFPSLYDTAGLVVQEAAVMGTPSIVVENTAPAELITDGVNGLICQDTAESLCAGLERFLYEMSAEQREAIRKNAQKSVPLPWEKVMKEVEERYKTLAARGRLKRKSMFARPGR
jgi:1,2-diacylglycerol 3-alpha-glucosyltransferase